MSLSLSPLVNFYQKATTYFQKANRNAGKEVMYYLGYMAHEGLGITADTERAFAYYKEAAEAGHLYSMLEVASAYADGDGVQADSVLSEQWYNKAEEAGYRN